jgi:hypothetical protein
MGFSPSDDRYDEGLVMRAVAAKVVINSPAITAGVRGPFQLSGLPPGCDHFPFSTMAVSTVGVSKSVPTGSLIVLKAVTVFDTEAR